MTKHILLADDSVTIQKVVELTFSEGDYRVVCVSNGKAAVQKIKDDRPDILLCDVIMPEMNGYEVASFVKKNPTFSGIPVILLTGTFEPFDEDKARQSGADTYITKPFDSRMLVDKVEELLKHRVVLDTSAQAAPVQVFQSRTEFTLGQGGPETPPPPAPAPKAPVETPFLRSEQIFSMGDEMPPLEAGAATLNLDRSQLVAPVAPVLLPVPAPALLQESKDESPFAMTVEEPAVVDLGPMSAEDAVPETAFDSVLAPPAGAPAGDVEIPPMEEDLGLTELRVGEAVEPTAEVPHGDVVIPEAGPGPWEEEEQAPMAPEAESELGGGAKSVSGAEDWGQSQRVAPPALEADAPEGEIEPTSIGSPFVEAEPEAPAAPEVIHSMTDQQEMVSEAQSLFDRQHEAPSEALGGEETSQLAHEGTASSAEPATSLLLPEEGVETMLPEVAASVEPPAAAEPVPEAPAEAAPTAAPPAVSPEEVHGMVRKMVEEAHPALVREVAASMAPGIIAETVREMAPAHIRQVALEAAPEHAAAAARDAVPEAAKQAVAGLAPEAIKQAVAEAAPAMVREAAQEHAAKAMPEAMQAAARDMIAQMVREMAPDLIRQVAWEVIPELAESVIRRRIQELEAEVS